MTSSPSSHFLSELQHRIERYKPLLEDEFGVTIGNVEGREFKISAWLNATFARSDRTLHGEYISKYGHPPTRLRRFLHNLEKTTIWIPAFALLYARHRLSGYVMRWQDEPPAVLVSFAGWSTADFSEKVFKLDQWTVHELAHGVWNQLTQDRDETRDHRWRLWNEGFAHYVADIYMRDAYPPGTTVDEDWSAFRQRGKCMVEDVVRRHGKIAVKYIPSRWKEFDTLAFEDHQRTKR